MVRGGENNPLEPAKRDFRRQQLLVPTAAAAAALVARVHARGGRDALDTLVDSAHDALDHFEQAESDDNHHCPGAVPIAVPVAVVAELAAASPAPAALSA